MIENFDLTFSKKINFFLVVVVVVIFANRLFLIKHVDYISLWIRF